MINTGASNRNPELATALRACRAAFAGVGLLSLVVNILYLSGSFFMLEVYDRVLPSRSIPTLVGLAVIIAVLYGFQGILDVVRTRLLVRIGASLDESLHGRIYEAMVQLPLVTARKGDGLQPLRDLDQIRSFLSSLGPTALFDLPWMPIYLAICYLFHPWIGIIATIGAVILISLTLLTEILTRKPTRLAAQMGAERNALAEASRRNAEVLRAMGMGARIAGRWGAANGQYMTTQRRASDVAGGLGAISKVLRMLLQSSVLGAGAFLVIRGEATAGIIIASSILTSRSLAPVELAIANWKGFMAARQSWRRLSELLALLPPRPATMALPRPAKLLSVESVSVAPPDQRRIVVQDVAFELKSGQALGVIGPSASGKSSLVRLIVGVWNPARGRIRLDGASLAQWSPDVLGSHIGYLPQDVELFAGSIAQNIARFDPKPDSAAVIAAARSAGVHDLILRLQEGYDTQIGESGTSLSAGQRQRVALARALYGDPFLVVLDEPNSNLDSEGEEALTRAILGVRARGGIAIVVAHRPSALAAVDTVLVMNDGRQQAFGPKDEVLTKVLRHPPTAVPPPAPTQLKVVTEAQGR
jgi:ATP-binding cassette subfamily C protein